jgi:hypothetical protein
MPKNVSKPTHADNDRRIIETIDTHLRHLPNIVLSGKSYTPAALKQVFLGRIQATHATLDAKARFDQAVREERDVRERTHLVEEALHKFVLGLFGQVVAPFRAHGARGRSTRQP